MSFTRRDFMAASALAGAWAMPAFFRQVAAAAPKADQPGGQETLLVVVQLTGGNDGLNTVIPVRDPRYAAARPTLKQPADQVKSIDADLAFHPSLGGFASLLEANELCIVQGVGYPQPNRSHFESMDIWQKAHLQPAQEQYGWLGRTSPLLGDGRGAMQIDHTDPPLALYGATGYAPSLRSIEDYKLRVAEKGDDPARRAAIERLAAAPAPPDDQLLAFLRSSAQVTYQSAERIRKAATEYKTDVVYPESPLARHLRLVAQFIEAGVPERIYYTSLEGFDTHAGQAISHGGLLQTLGDALAAFHKDVANHGHADRVVTLVFSEFGRRVAENGSQGTDHGTGAPLFVCGRAVKPGLCGAHPSLEDLEEGDLKHHTDFRSVYATLLEKWLRVDPAQVLTGTFPQLELFA